MCFFTSGEIEDSTNKPTRKFAKVLWAGVERSFTFFTKEHREKILQQCSLEGAFVVEYNAVSIASKRMGCHKKSIAKVCSGAQKSSGGSIKCFKKGWFLQPFLFVTIP